MIDRSAFRAHALDGAMLYFHPPTGTHVRVQAPSTRHLRREAPRAVMFGITNHCNLSCSFCSRDAEKPSTWTVESAAAILEGLSAAGTLEVAFGGGEPFAFKGFEALLLRLHARTALALHVTTNGTLLDDGALARLRGVLGRVRLSIYEDQPWRLAADKLTHAGQAWGANVLVDDASLPALPALLDELLSRGARDASLLSYVGPDRTKHLSHEGELLLSAIVRASRLPCRVSVCFGDRLHGVPTLGGGDCGAGRDFISITADRRLQSCSFQDRSIPIDSASDVLAAWRTQQDWLARASSRSGCARGQVRTPDASGDGLHVWQAFSGNNSGECLVVARFETAADADALVKDLADGWTPGEAYSAPWKELFAREGVTSPDGSDAIMPDELTSIGRTFVARTDYAAGDDFPALRALAWKRSGEVVAGGVHVHETSTLIAVVRAKDHEESSAIVAAAGVPALAHGREALLALPMDKKLVDLRASLETLAAGSPFVAEPFFDPVKQEDLVAVAKRLGHPAATRPRLLVCFWRAAPESAAKAKTFAAGLDVPATAVSGLVLIEGVERRKRLALLSLRHGAGVSALDAEVLAVEGQFWSLERDAPALDPAQVTRDLADVFRRALGPAPFVLHPTTIPWGTRVQFRVDTAAAAQALLAAEVHARAQGLMSWLGVSDTDRLARTVARLRADLGS